MTEAEEKQRERNREAARQWYREHREEAKARARAWKEANMDRYREYNRRYREQRAERRIAKEREKNGFVTKETIVSDRIERARKLFKDEDAKRHAAWLIEHRYHAKH